MDLNIIGAIGDDAFVARDDVNAKTNFGVYNTSLNADDLIEAIHEKWDRLNIWRFAADIDWDNDDAYR